MAPFFASSLETFGGGVAVVVDGGERVTYAELAKQADAFAARLGAGRRLIVVECANRLEPLVAYLGALRAGHPVILTSPDAPDREQLLATYQPDFLVHADGRLETWSREDRNFHPDLALLLSTSGTTGSAKLVRLSGENLQANAASIAEYLTLDASERPILSLPLHYSFGLSIANSHLQMGATLLLSGRSVVEPAFWSFVEANEATSLSGVPYTYELLERVGFRQKPPGKLGTLTQAGGRLPADLVASYAEWADQTGGRFFVMYGQTEAAPRMAYVPPHLLAENPDCIGIAIPGGRFRLIDEAGEAIEGPNIIGELVYAGPNVMLGYAHCVADLALGRDVEELRTGDLATRNEAGLYRLAGRKSRFAKLFGLRIGLDEVEAHLRSLGVRSVAVSDDNIIALSVIGPADSVRIQAALADGYKLPADTFHVDVRDDQPTLPSGKIDYRSILKTAQVAARLPAEAAAPADGAQRLRNAFRRAFQREPQPDDSFVSLGGDSLNYVVVSLEVEECLGFIPDLWEERSLAELQALIPSTNTRAPRFRMVESETLIRALAITAVVINHASNFAIGGGAEVLILLAGYNLSRYQRNRLADNHAIDIVTSFIKRIIVPYYVMMIVFMALKMEFDIPSIFLVSNFVGRFGSILEAFWFLEVLLQCMIVVAALMAIPALRRLVARDPWLFGIGLLGAAVGVKVGFAIFYSTAHLMNRTPDAVFFLLAFGWCVQQAETVGRRLGLSLVVCLLVLLEVRGLPARAPLPHPMNYTHAIWLVTSTLLILWLPRVRIPRPLHAPLTTIAAASFYIYLTHVIPVHILYWWAGYRNLALNVTVALLLGICVWYILQRVDLKAAWQLVSRRARTVLARTS